MECARSRPFTEGVGLWSAMQALPRMDKVSGTASILWRGTRGFWNCLEKWGVHGATCQAPAAEARSGTVVDPVPRCFTCDDSQYNPGTHAMGCGHEKAIDP